ncbi:hypothetical protein [Hydrocarboniphaga sp.]|uniref:hypothetical protein n=1 Tax=Hydrocarboniphaga sp. TaxID=2033016 RepID=UPI003D126A1F
MAENACFSVTKATKIKVEENGRKATFLNERRLEFIRTQMDGCLVKNQTAADWVVSRRSVADVIVELKGKDVKHAIDQILASAIYLTEKGLRNGKLAGLVVCRQYPRFDTTIQRGQMQFAKIYKGPIRIESKNKEYNFDEISSF